MIRRGPVILWEEVIYRPSPASGQMSDLTEGRIRTLTKQAKPATFLTNLITGGEGERRHGCPALHTHTHTLLICIYKVNHITIFACYGMYTEYTKSSAEP